MSAIRTTNLGSLSLINYTRYNTDDIMALLNRVEAQAAATKNSAGQVWLAERLSETAPAGTAPTIIFKNFTGKPRVEYNYNTAPKSPVGLVFLAQARWSKPNEFRALPPDALYMNAVEALAAASTPNPQLPDRFLLQLADRFQNLFEHWGYRRGGRSSPANISGLSIRIDSKASAKPPKRSAKVVSKEHALTAYADVKYRSERVKGDLESLGTVFSRMERAAKKAGFAASLMEDLEACFRALEAARERAAELYNRLSEET